METPHWLDFAAVAASIVAFVLSAIAITDVRSMKRLDLRLALRTCVAEAHVVLDGIVEFLDKAFISRRDNFNAAGRLRSGLMQAFENQVGDDKLVAMRLLNELPSTDETFKKLSPADLEKKLVQMRTTLTRAKGLREKYETTMREDKEQVAARVEAKNREWENRNQ